LVKEGSTTYIPARLDPTAQHLDAPRSIRDLREYQGPQAEPCGIVFQLPFSDFAVVPLKKAHIRLDGRANKKEEKKIVDPGY
jgi:hypothetical protein